MIKNLPVSAKPGRFFALFFRFPILSEQSAGTAGMDEQNVVIGLVETLPGPAHQTCKGLAGVAGVQHDALQLHHHSDGFVALVGGDGIAGAPHLHQIGNGNFHIHIQKPGGFPISLGTITSKGSLSTMEHITWVSGR